MRVAILDMGSKMYGDCIFVELDGFTLLIDGGHPNDATGGADIPRQLKRLTGKSKWHVDLLVVTHSHDDHVGCLPRMVESGLLTARFALVSDPAHRWADLDDTDALDVGEAGQRLLDVLGEELPDPQVDRDGFNQALDVARDLKGRYREMIAALKQKGTTVVRYQTDAIKPITNLLKGRGVKILGPTRKHLARCRAALAEARDEVRERIRDVVAQDADVSLPELYLRVLGASGRDAAGGLDAASRSKGAINNLSIVLSVTLARKRILLPGDMQFAGPETEALEPDMAALIKKVAAAGPYAAVKLPHHTSYNGWDETLHRTTLSAPLLIHSGGVDDSHHPEDAALRMMQRFRAGHTFLRTDRNGLILLQPGPAGLVFDMGGGEIDDFTPNLGSDVSGGAAPEPAVVTTRVVPARPGEAGIVRVTADVPNAATKVVITVEVNPDGHATASLAPAAVTPVAPKAIGPTAAFSADWLKRCNGILFVTNQERLGRKLGDDNVARLEDAVENAGAAWIGAIPFPFAAEEIRKQIETALSEREHRGVVVLGDYDVTAPARFDCLPEDVREGIGAEVDDPDNFVVWSDGPYGDRDSNGIQEVPVSRVPDAGSPEFFWRCLTRPYASLNSGYMLRNVNRPFADQVHALLPNGSRRLESRPTRPNTLRPEQLRDAHVYLMLHGSDYDAGRFWGEEEDGHVEAINCATLPESLNGVVFAGCCWGAMIGREPAYRVVTDDPPLSRRIEDSMALSCLARGAAAFVGCTGAHYSPVSKPYNYYGHPLHASFWEAIREGQPPSAALFSARQTYRVNLPHPTPGDRPALDELAIELKIYQQFTCLGFGW